MPSVTALAQDRWYFHVPVSLLALALLPGTPGRQAPPGRAGLPGWREPGVGEGKGAQRAGSPALCSEKPPLRAPLQRRGWAQQSHLPRAPVVVSAAASRKLQSPGAAPLPLGSVCTFTWCGRESKVSGRCHTCPGSASACVQPTHRLICRRAELTDVLV